MTLALLCSGQGHQNREMFGLLAAEPAAHPVFEAATAVLGTHPTDFCRTASETALHANREGQILCVTRALAIARALFPVGAPSETMVAGYSVGEMAAWGVAGVWSPMDTLRLVDQRARAMDAVGGPDDGLGYVRGLPRATVEQLAGRFGCAIAIVNPDLLFIVGGDRRSIDALCTAALEEGAARAAPMMVHVASHTPRLAGAVAPFDNALASAVMSRPTLRLMTASGATLVADPHRARKGLARQVAERIDWADVIEALGERGMTAILELGPGRALAEMAAAALPSVKVRAVDDFHSLAGVKVWLAAL
ncbi:acyltransferase domain-containing protein [Rhizobium sp. P40RR-XXII]|uniref:ACP S-malonyltransferase n=1 Tax=unclassified Rhizobium TaxID=2613769 RepID=UPI0014567A17|nr:MULTISPECIES: acyltransferase domain-containing protein [unclassified Rhizobium]NLR84810.1 acyltransferase domain-containing protein [Rhizobium sp. P28RR-XV]NLS16283.1 acyltransferase domain-containing protein [Rhizobium sp. P40RR-XXII]